MVRLSKIYTKTGDGGRTMLGDGSMARKHDVRVEAYGTVDEANALLGLVLINLPKGGSCAVGDDIRQTLALIQNDLFDLGADLCVPIAGVPEREEKLRIIPEQIAWLERTIDRFNADLPALNSFVLPGGTPAAAHLHAARTVCRRAERLVCHLIELSPEATNAQAMVYLNRLSDLLFVLARIANTEAMGGEGDVLWVPGASRARERG
ncbi:MAG: cob(I)yrinic acid a,c-diamide adenosyltransferase [Phycisphaerales bacterium]